MQGRTVFRVRACIGLAIVGLIGSMGGGCVGYTTYSLNPQDAKVLRTPNSLGVQDVVITSARWILDRYPPSGKPNPLRDPRESPTSETFALNLPYGLSEESTRVILKNLEPGAQPMLEENASLPIYHISYIRIRGDEADVHAFRPIYSIGPKPTGETLYQEMRLKLRGGMRQWRVVYGLNWTPGTGQPPPIHFIQRPREPGEYVNPSVPAPRDETMGDAPRRVEPEPEAPAEPEVIVPEGEPASDSMSQDALEIGEAGGGASPGVAEPRAESNAEPLLDLPFNPIWDAPPKPE